MRKKKKHHNTHRRPVLQVPQSTDPSTHVTHKTPASGSTWPGPVSIATGEDRDGRQRETQSELYRVFTASGSFHMAVNATQRGKNTLKLL
ncbi:hypothetical protein JOB18_034726 [Solea senegalensis]|uniref:Uncharacterized protein n=1 Tax=Solea senegalensis TaxID=28829 RepID=A0AAV6QGZ3_SOLSE|nr:hypothetical protein JOB18_034726 [Solea senegalensis]